MKKFFIGVATTLAATWAWKKFNVSEKLAPVIERVRTFASEKLAACQKKADEEAKEE